MSEIALGNLKLHVALLPSSGMGHLTPFLRLAASLIAGGVRVTLVATYPTVSLAEMQALSRFFGDFPQVVPQRFDLVSVAENYRSTDVPFYHHFEVIRRSCHLLRPVLSSASPPLSAIITDMSLMSAVLPITEELGLPNYVLFTSSAKMFTLFSSFHNLANSPGNCNPSIIPDFLEIPSRHPIHAEWLPRLLQDKGTNFFKSYFIENGKSATKARGIIINTFEAFEQETLEELNDDDMFPGYPPLFAVGPLPPVRDKNHKVLAWLDEQEAASVIYVSFGSRTAISKEQLKELGSGLVRSSCRFLWAVKNKTVDDEDKENIDDLLGFELANSARSRGLVVKEWVVQSEILAHESIGGFLSHCGWNSVTEAAWHGVPILAWPQHGDQKINASVVERAGVGLWDKRWGWGENTVVTGEAIAKRIRDVLGNDGLDLRAQARRIKESARRAMGADERSFVKPGGTFSKRCRTTFHSWKNESHTFENSPKSQNFSPNTNKICRNKFTI